MSDHLEATLLETKRNNREKDRAKDAARELINFVNSYTHDEKAFADYICHEHRTLQQSVMRLFIEVCRAMAETDTDERNEQASKLAGKIIKEYGDWPLPFI